MTKLNLTIPIDTDAYAQEVIRLTNIEREKNGLPALDVDSEAMDYAQIRAEEISISFSHTRINGGERLSGTLENLTARRKTPKDAVTAWMDSPGHRGGIMDENVYAIGVGVYQAPNGDLYWVQIFFW